ITGFAHERIESAEEDSNLRLKIRKAVLACVDSTKYAVWIHTIRRKKSLKTEGEYKRDFSGYLNHFWNDKNYWEHKFVNEVYITIVREGKFIKPADLHILAHCFIPNMSYRYLESHLEQACKELSAVTKRMMPILDAYGAKLLGIVQRGDTYYSE